VESYLEFIFRFLNLISLCLNEFSKFLPKVLDFICSSKYLPLILNNL